MLCCGRWKLSVLEVRLIAMIMSLYNVKGYHGGVATNLDTRPGASNNLCRKRKNVNLYILNLKVSLPTRSELT